MPLSSPLPSLIWYFGANGDLQSMGLAASDVAVLCICLLLTSLPMIALAAPIPCMCIRFSSSSYEQVGLGALHSRLFAFLSCRAEGWRCCAVLCCDVLVRTEV